MYILREGAGYYCPPFFFIKENKNKTLYKKDQAGAGAVAPSVRQSNKNTQKNYIVSVRHTTDKAKRMSFDTREVI